jgi:tripartite-type tricarboxylate transporter receptor subunit TctC
VIDRLGHALNDAVKSDEAIEKLKAQGFEPLGGTPEELAGFIETEMRKWSAAAQAAGLKK